MDLREIKREVAALPDVSKTVDNFSQSWVRPIRSNTNSHLSFLQNLPDETKRSLNTQLVKAHQTATRLRNSAHLKDKLHRYTRSMVDLTLSQMQDNPGKTRMITNQLLNDDFFSLPKTIQEVRDFDNDVSTLSGLYHNINDLLHDHLSLEQTVMFMELPHYRYLQTLMKTSQQQKFIVRDIGHHFVSVTKKDAKKAA